jgi:hypothetical protein
MLRSLVTPRIRSTPFHIVTVVFTVASCSAPPGSSASSSADVPDPFAQRAMALGERLVDAPAARDRLAAARSLEALGTRAIAAIPELILALEDGDSEVEVAAAQALASTMTSSPEVIDALARRAQRADVDFVRADAGAPRTGGRPVKRRPVRPVSALSA